MGGGIGLFLKPGPIVFLFFHDLGRGRAKRHPTGNREGKEGNHMFAPRERERPHYSHDEQREEKYCRRD